MLNAVVALSRAFVWGLSWYECRTSAWRRYARFELFVRLLGSRAFRAEQVAGLCACAGSMGGGT